MSNGIEILPLSPDRLAFLAFFDGTAFSDNPKWSSCYCQCFYEDHRVVTWSTRTAAENKALACQRTARDEMQGLDRHDADGSVCVRKGLG